MLLPVCKRYINMWVWIGYILCVCSLIKVAALSFHGSSIFSHIFQHRSLSWSKNHIFPPSFPSKMINFFPLAIRKKFTPQVPFLPFPPFCFILSFQLKFLRYLFLHFPFNIFSPKWQRLICPSSPRGGWDIYLCIYIDIYSTTLLFN